MSKVPVVTGLYVVEKFEESERKSTKISRGRCMVVKLRKRGSAPMCLENHALTLLEIHFLG